MSEPLRNGGTPARSTAGPEREARLAAFLREHRDRLLRADPAALVEAVVRGGSDLGRFALAAKVNPSDPARALGTAIPLGELPDTARPEALRDLAEALARRPRSRFDLAHALDLYRLAEAMEGPEPVPDRHRSLHAQLILLVDPADRAAIERLDTDPHARAALRSDLAHPHHGGEAASFLAAFGDFAGWDDLELDPDGSAPLLDRLRGTAPASSVEGGPLVSVLMTCRDPGPELLTAVRSVAAQTWSAWELLLVDDGTTDPEARARLAAALSDPRIRLLRRPESGGTYRARNQGLAEAAGEFVTGLDSDDWAHPRWLEQQVAPLLADPELVMTQSLGVRADADLRLVTAPRSRFTEPRSTSMTVRTALLRERFGGFDAVLKGADSELRLRIQKTVGSRRRHLDQVAHTIVRQRPGSLSGGEVGDGWMHPVRAVYESAFTHWHRAVQRKESRPAMPAEGAGARPFPAPRQLVRHGERPPAPDLVYVGDWRYDGPAQRAMRAAMAAERRRGRTVAVAHCASWFSLEERHTILSAEAIEFAAAEAVDWIDPQEASGAAFVAMDAAIAIELESDPRRSVTVLEGPSFMARRAEGLRRLRGAAKGGPAGLRRLPRRLLRGKRAALKRLAGKAKRRALAVVRGSRDREAPTPEQRRELDLWQSRLHGGWSASATAALSALAEDPSLPKGTRIAALRALTDWLDEDHHRHQRGRRLDLDVVLVSNFSMPGGTTSSNAEEIRAFRAAGLRVGLLHHRVHDWPLDRPLNPKIAELVDDEGVVVLSAHDSVRCDLAIVRFPRIMMRPMEDLPRITAERTVLVVNQPPYEYYGPEQGRVLTWDVRTVHANLTSWLGEHTWYAQGPVVRDAFAVDHDGELDGIDLSADYWFGIVDPDAWRRDLPRPRSGPVRIGRHARDHVRKWPESTGDLLACYPDDDEFEIHVLGGARSARRLLGTLPANWVVHDFGSMSPKEFLHDVDVLVFFIADAGQEAFGRTPLEAMAVGLPCILPPSFKPLYGDGALYCEPAEVADLVRSLADDPAAYRRQSELALARVRRDFSREFLLERVRGLGVGAVRREAAAA
ncbi:glycosyltransferase [Glycomyces paridis]|uniref:Glycosyltransferase n=1 Tax=Glycomyces paridis TaxID=2126555 RepID=A0A4S8PI81_9ACTN|nr:glycosyltransferase [Glycomyces paridis]THV28034.1 glycosyltransferase [Glycomyces paridis]